VAERLRLTSPYLDVLEAQRAALVDALRPALTAGDIEAAHRESARLSVRLDASPLEDETAAAVDRGEGPDQPVPGGDRDGAGWASALRLEGMPSQDIAAMEYRGVRAAQAEEAGLAAAFFDAPVATLAGVQRHVAAGLIDDERLGALRSTSRAVHDGAQGRVIFHAPPPERLPDLLAELDAWVRRARSGQDPLVIAGVVHARLLHWRPFEAANGRVARLASRIALRASGGDPWGVAVPERVLVRDPLSYASEIAATIRRGTDLRPWNERAAEAVVAGLEHVARRHRLAPEGVDARAMRACGAVTPGDTVTVPQVAGAAGLDRSAALVQCNLLCWAGLLRRDVGTHGLRYVRKATDVSDRAGRSPWNQWHYPPAVACSDRGRG
jgi:hypothetical protein